MPGSEFDRAVHEFLREYAVPKPLREARVAERLTTVEPVRVAFALGRPLQLAARVGTRGHVGARLAGR